MWSDVLDEANDLTIGAFESGMPFEFGDTSFHTTHFQTDPVDRDAPTQFMPLEPLDTEPFMPLDPVEPVQREPLEQSFDFANKQDFAPIEFLPTASPTASPTVEMPVAVEMPTPLPPTVDMPAAVKMPPPLPPAVELPTVELPTVEITQAMPEPTQAMPAHWPAMDAVDRLLLPIVPHVPQIGAKRKLDVLLDAKRVVHFGARPPTRPLIDFPNELDTKTLNKQATLDKRKMHRKQTCSAISDDWVLPLSGPHGLKIWGGTKLSVSRRRAVLQVLGNHRGRWITLEEISKLLNINVQTLSSAFSLDRLGTTLQKLQQLQGQGLSQGSQYVLRQRRKRKVHFYLAPLPTPPPPTPNLAPPSTPRSTDIAATSF